MTVEAVDLGTFDPYAAAGNQEELEVEIVHGTGAGKISTLAMPKAQMQRPASPAINQNIVEWPLRLVPIPDTGNDQDVFVNVTGGIRVSETASDLAVALAIQSSLRDMPLPDKLAAFGEVGLSGELRPVYNGEERLREAAGQGFRRALVPQGNLKGVKAKIEARGYRRLADAMAAAREAG